MNTLLERLRGGLRGLQWLALLTGILVFALLNLILTLLLPARSHAELWVNFVAALLAAGIAPYLLRAIDRMQQKVERQNNELRSLHAIDSALSRQLNLQALADIAVGEATRAVNGEMGALWLFDPADPARVGTQAFYNIPVDRHYMASEQLAAVGGPEVRRTGLPQRRGELDATWPTDRNARLLKLRSTLVVPIKHQETLLGLMLIGNAGGASPLSGFSDDDSALLVATASTLSVAIQNARLYEETQRRGEQLRALVAHTGEAVAASSDARRLMQILADAAARIVGCARVAVYAYGSDGAGGGAPTLLHPLAFHGAVPSEGAEGAAAAPLRLSASRLLLVAGVEDGAARYVPNVWMALGLDPSESFPASPGYLCVLRSRDRRGLGLLCLLDDAPRPPSPDRDAFAQALAAQASVGLENAQLAAQVKIDAERDKHVAEVFQTSMLPPVPARIGAFEFAHKYQSALDESTLGGDFYDLFPLGGNLVGVVMADVSGKGLKAAVQTAMVKYMLRGFAHETPRNPGSVLAHVNGVLCGESAGFEGFVTLFFGVLDTQAGDFLYSVAGHEPPLWRDAASGSVLPLGGESGLPLGSIAGGDYETASRRFAPGDSVLLHTDGLSEARSPQNAFLGTEGLQEYVAGAYGDAAGAVEAVFSRVRAFTGDSLRDDVAMLLLRRAG